MSGTIHEVDFTARVAGWINRLAEVNGPDFPVSEARIEGRSKGSQRRRDLTVYDRKGLPCLTGEIKLPWASDGHSPYLEMVVQDAREKAEKAGVHWFVTWNVNELLLWRREDVAVLGNARTVERYQIANIQRPEDFENEKVLDAVREGVERFITLFARALRGERGVERRPPDLYFIHSLESFLERPIQLTRFELRERYKRQKEREKLDNWMKDQQGWALVGDEHELLLRAAKFTNYAIVNRLIFYEALRKRFAILPELTVPPHVDSGERIFEHFRAYFDEARHVTGDYETVFGLDPNDVGDRIPFYDSAVVDSWRRLTQHVHLFDFSRLDYDVVGQIFETLIGPEERHKYGQYYTRPEVVDVINSFCIRNGEDRVMDPGCGGGTFLVRAYARKKYLSPRLAHLGLLRGIIGVDISRFATHLSTMNLASRDLVEAENYPRVVRSDFFDLRASKPIMTIPGSRGLSIETLANGLDAVVGNPPYVRQEDIPKDKKDAYRALVKRESKLSANGRSDLHIFFWGHAVSFLKQGGRLGFLTSSQWLDVEYGFPLQQFLLERFSISAIIESRIEPWFVGARVQTVVTIAELEQNPQKRTENVVRFVEIRRPLAEVLTSDGTSVGAIAAADELRDLILSTNEDVTTDLYSIRCMRQGELLEDGVRTGLALKGEATYAGAKWGIPLRAPDLWRELQTLGASHWKPLSELAQIRRGLTTGADKFFYVDDVTTNALDAIADPIGFEMQNRVTRKAVESGAVKIVKNGYGEVFPIESQYLEPVIHSLMHIDRYEVTKDHCAHLALMVGKHAEALKGTLVASYIERGEQQGVHRGSTVAARATTDRPWYDLTYARKAELLWAKSHQYRHCAPLNPNRYAANCNLYTIDVKGDSLLAAAVLDSTVVLLAKHLYGRPVGVEGNLKTEVIDVNMMPVPDWTQAGNAVRKKLLGALARMRERPVLGLLSEQRLRRATLLQRGQIDRLEALSDLTEFDADDRQEIDDAVLQLLGLRDVAKRKEFRSRLYAYLEDYFEYTRRKEEQAILNKAVSKGRDKLTPQALAQDVFVAIERDHVALLKGYRNLAQIDGETLVEGIRLPAQGKPEIVDDLLMTGVRFRRGRSNGEIVQTRSANQARLLVRIVELGEAGRSHFVPVDEAVIKRQIKRIDELLRARNTKTRKLIAARTNDPEISRKAFDLVMARF